jgi:hypothetical protein
MHLQVRWFETAETASRQINYENTGKKFQATVAPDSPAAAGGAEVVERNSEFGRNDRETVQPNANAIGRRITDAAREDAGVTGKK